mgnify:FL=1
MTDTVDPFLDRLLVALVHIVIIVPPHVRLLPILLSTLQSQAVSELALLVRQGRPRDSHRLLDWLRDCGSHFLAWRGLECLFGLVWVLVTVWSLLLGKNDILRLWTFLDNSGLLNARSGEVFRRLRCSFNNWLSCFGIFHIRLSGNRSILGAISSHNSFTI